jgi:hypothetical protein
LQPQAYPAAEMLCDWGVLVLDFGDQTFGLLITWGYFARR